MQSKTKIYLSACLAVMLFTQIAAAAGQAEAGDLDIKTACGHIAATLEKGTIESPGRIVIVYFTPRDGLPAMDHHARIRRIVEETAGFYEKELGRHGFSGRRMRVLRNDVGEVEIIDVTGHDLDRDYGKPDGAKIREEVNVLLRERKIDPEKSLLLLFCNLMDYDSKQGTISHHSPYYGGGTYLQGCAWQCDSQILDPLRLKDPTPILDGEYGKITIGKHNSIFIGGVIHELGHALSLPHCQERDDQKKRGVALMGSGNQTYGQQLRGEGLGTFLTQAHAVRLAAHPVFNERVTSLLYERPKVTWKNLDCSVTVDRQIRVQGRVVADLPVFGVIAYFDAEGGGDYDATTAVAIPNAGGEFILESRFLPPNLAGELRLVTCHVNGSVDTRSFAYRVDEQGTPDVSSTDFVLRLGPVLDALRKGSVEKATTQLNILAKGNSALQSSGERVLARFREGWSNEDPVQTDLHSISKDANSIRLSHITPNLATVGWIHSSYDSVPSPDRLLSLDGDYFANGIYAHAPAKHEYSLEGKWAKLKGRCGLQSGNFGKVDFEIHGDGRSLWNAHGVVDGNSADFDVELAGVDRLTLIVTDGGDGPTGDWGVWIEPTLSR